jgi:hypothetical protein
MTNSRVVIAPLFVFAALAAVPSTGQANFTTGKCLGALRSQERAFRDLEESPARREGPANCEIWRSFG